MAGTGKYTVYAPPANDKNNLLNKLFRSSNPSEQPPTQDMVGKESGARAAILAIATAPVVNGVGGIQPSNGVQAGDPGMFPQGVSLDFSGKLASIQPPDTAEGKDVTWQRPGDPANSYVPDISSP